MRRFPISKPSLTKEQTFTYQVLNLYVTTYNQAKASCLVHVVITSMVYVS